LGKREGVEVLKILIMYFAVEMGIVVVGPLGLELLRPQGPGPCPVPP
jgi:hypothetical protein